MEVKMDGLGKITRIKVSLTWLWVYHLSPYTGLNSRHPEPISGLPCGQNEFQEKSPGIDLRSRRRVLWQWQWGSRDMQWSKILRKLLLLDHIQRTYSPRRWGQSSVFLFSCSVPWLQTWVHLRGVHTEQG